MRMWMVDPKILCTKHLLGEHVECHMFAGSLKKGTSLKGFLDNNLFEPTSLQERHQTLSKEMVERGMKHKSDLIPININHLPPIKVNEKESLKDLLSRCPECLSRYEKVYK